MPPKLRADETDAEELRRQIARHAGLAHLRVRRHGDALIVESGPAGEPVRHLRLRRETAQRWRLDIANHRDQWESAGESGPLPKLVDLVVTAYPWTLEKIV
jgi:hypothetical protein